MAHLPTGKRRRLLPGCLSRRAGRTACGALMLLVLMVVCGGAQASRWGKDYVPNVPVVTQDGKVFNFYDDLVKDKIFVVSFLFTSCRDVCPIAAARMAQLQERLGDRVGKDVFLYSISIDPANDTPDKLKKYAETFAAGPGWLFLTGIPEDINLIRQRLGERSRFLGEHRNDVMLGNGFTSEWQRDSLMGDMERFIAVLEALDQRASKRAPVSEHGGKVVEAYEIKGPPGEALFIKVCSGCHTVGRGDRVGPDLAGISQRRQRAWLVDFIASPERMRARKDPIALALMAKYPNVRMPGVGIAEDEAAELVAYIEGYRKPQPIGLDPLLALTTQHGKRLTTDDLKGRPLAIAFGFTHCPDVCPTTLLEWSNALAELGPAGDKLKVLFVSVDSERDTPEKLKGYMAAFDARITALTGSPEEIAAAAATLDAFYEKVPGADGSFTFDHSIKTYVLDGEHRLAGSLDLNSEASVRRKLLAPLLVQK
ncbi:MAG TPA: SCO family protein [Burkholderiales bacterium]|nr:SCO family protein [Burkholderiales bacterium]